MRRAAAASQVGVGLVTDHTIYACVVGSRGYGLDRAGSDVDRRGVFLAPTPLFWGLTKPPSHVDGPGMEQFSWELERYCELALQANPTVMECLWSPIVESVTDVGRELLALRGAFLSSAVADTYGNYARDQFQRLANTRRRTGEIRWKQAMHMLRLLLAGAWVLREGEVLVDVRAHRADLLAVRDGERTWEEVTAWSDRLVEDLAVARSQTRLPSEPDSSAIEEFLVRTRRRSACD